VGSSMAQGGWSVSGIQQPALYPWDSLESVLGDA
jgi:hypothetical protein